MSFVKLWEIPNMEDFPILSRIKTWQEQPKLLSTFLIVLAVRISHGEQGSGAWGPYNVGHGIFEAEHHVLHINLAIHQTAGLLNMKWGWRLFLVSKIDQDAP